MPRMPKSKIKTVLAIFFVFVLAAGAIGLTNTLWREWYGPVVGEPASSQPFALTPTTLINAQNPLPEKYVPALEPYGGVSVNSLLLPSLQYLVEAAARKGITLQINQGYRSPEESRQMLEERTLTLARDGYSLESARKEAAKSVAPPYQSEHNAGLAVDVTVIGDEGLAWTLANLHKYGFILRYPENKTAITGIVYEPWHFRYVGTEAAAEIYKKKLCLEEYNALKGRS